MGCQAVKLASKLAATTSTIMEEINAPTASKLASPANAAKIGVETSVLGEEKYGVALKLAENIVSLTGGNPSSTIGM